MSEQIQKHNNITIIFVYSKILVLFFFVTERNRQNFYNYIDVKFEMSAFVFGTFAYIPTPTARVMILFFLLYSMCRTLS